MRGACSRMPPKQGGWWKTFLVDSWLEHLRQHERVTNADRTLQDVVRRFHTHGAPKVTHLIASEPDHALTGFRTRLKRCRDFSV
jgi:Transmembrane secretion effector